MVTLLLLSIQPWKWKLCLHAELPASVYSSFMHTCQETTVHQLMNGGTHYPQWTITTQQKATNYWCVAPCGSISETTGRNHISNCQVPGDGRNWPQWGIWKFGGERNTLSLHGISGFMSTCTCLHFKNWTRMRTDSLLYNW